MGAIHRFDTAGRWMSSMQTPAWVGTKVAFQRDRNLATERLAANNLWAFRLSFPGEPKRPYVIGLSASGFTPGIPIWACALTLDPAAPGGIATVSKPVVLVLE